MGNRPDHPESGARVVESEKAPGGVNGKKHCLPALDIRHLRDVIFVEDMNFNLTYVSPSVTALFGYTVEEALRLQKQDLMTPDALKSVMAKFQKFASSAENEGDIDIPLMEYEYVRKDGSSFWGELKVTFLRDLKGY